MMKKLLLLIQQFYEEYTKVNAMTNSYRISSDDYLALRELLQFSGIPRYMY